MFIKYLLYKAKGVNKQMKNYREKLKSESIDFIIEETNKKVTFVPLEIALEILDNIESDIGGIEDIIGILSKQLY